MGYMFLIIQIMQFLFRLIQFRLYPELSSEGNYIGMHSNEEEILMRRQGWKDVTQSKRNESVQRKNTDSSNTKSFDCISGVMQRLKIHTWQLQGLGRQNSPHWLQLFGEQVCDLSPDKLSTSFAHFRSFPWYKWQKLALSATRVASSRLLLFGWGQTVLPKMLNFIYFHFFPLIV